MGGSIHDRHHPLKARDRRVASQVLADVGQHGLDVSTEDGGAAVDFQLEAGNKRRENEAPGGIKFHDGKTLIPVFENLTLALSPGFLPRIPNGKPTRPLTPTM